VKVKVKVTPSIPLEAQKGGLGIVVFMLEFDARGG